MLRPFSYRTYPVYPRYVISTHHHFTSKLFDNKISTIFFQVDVNDLHDQLLSFESSKNNKDDCAILESGEKKFECHVTKKKSHLPILVANQKGKICPGTNKTGLIVGFYSATRFVDILATFQTIWWQIFCFADFLGLTVFNNCNVSNLKRWDNSC